MRGAWQAIASATPSSPHFPPGVVLRLQSPLEMGPGACSKRGTQDAGCVGVGEGLAQAVQGSLLRE